jgi:hypothetical protein
VPYVWSICLCRKSRNTRRKTVRDPARQKGRLCAPPAAGRKRWVNAHPSPTAINEHGATRNGIAALIGKINPPPRPPDQAREPGSEGWRGLKSGLDDLAEESCIPKLYNTDFKGGL